VAQVGHYFGRTQDAFADKEVSFLSDTINLMLLTSAYVPNQPSHTDKSDVVANEVSGTGYTAGGQALTSKTVMYVDSSVPAATWTALTAYTAGQVVQGSVNGAGYIFKCTTAGTSLATAPTFNLTLDGTTTDGATLVWTCVGQIATAWAATHAYVVNDIVRPTTSNGFIYRCTVAGTSGGAQPSFPTTPIGATVTDGGVTWLLVGFGQTILSGATITWSASTISAAFAALYDATPSTDATRPLLMYIDFGGTLASTNGNFSVQWDSHGIMPFYAA
jgi:hypothetical protein